MGRLILLFFRRERIIDGPTVRLERIGTVGWNGIPGLAVSVVDDLLGALVVFENAKRDGITIKYPKALCFQGFSGTCKP